MNKFPVFVFSFIMLISIQANTAEICGVQIRGAQNAEEARQRATASLAQAINSKVSSQSTMKETIFGTESEQRDTTIQQVTSQLLNAQAAKYTDGIDYYGYFSKACMSREDAAKPYLDQLREQDGKLRNAVLALGGRSGKKESWENVVAIYKKLKDLESVLIPLGQMETVLQKNYEANYAKAEKEYKSFLQPNKGVYVESTSSYFQSKISSFLSDYGCILVEESETTALNLEFNVKECEQRKDMNNNAYCRVCIDMNLSDSKGKILYKDNFTSSKTGWTDMETACKKTMENAVQETWEKIKGKINRGDCK
jgi:hypothetical protein